MLFTCPSKAARGGGSRSHAAGRGVAEGTAAQFRHRDVDLRQHLEIF